MPETKENKFGAAFHAHLDACAQCREHPFDLCPTGSLLLRSSVTEDVVRLEQQEAEADVCSAIRDGGQ